MTVPGVRRENKSLLRRWWWLWLSLLWVVIGLLFAAQTVWLGGFAWNAAIGWAILDWGLWVPIAPFVVWLAGRLTIHANSWRWAVPLHVVLSIVVAAAIELTSVLALHKGWMPDPRPRPSAGGESALFRIPPATGLRTADAGATPPDFRPPHRFDPGAGRPFAPGDRRRRPFPLGTGRGRLALPIYFVLVAGTHAVAYHRRSLERERRALLAEARLADARALALQTQLQPHFFFNALNTVASLIYTQPEQAEETLCALGELMRGVLDASDRREIPLREELAFIDRYLVVQRIRFGPRLTVSRDIPEETLACPVPTLFLQPLVENAVVHGVAPFSAPGTVTLRARRTDRHLTIEIANTCAGADTSADTAPLAFRPRVGLANTRARLEALYGADFQLGHRREPDGSVVTEVAIPWRAVHA